MFSSNGYSNNTEIGRFLSGALKMAIRANDSGHKILLEKRFKLFSYRTYYEVVIIRKQLVAIILFLFI